MGKEQLPEMPENLATLHSDLAQCDALHDEDWWTGPDMYTRDVAEEWQQAALIDAKTGLPNGKSFSRTLERFNQSHRSGALIILDLNGLKTVNDEMGGHGVGDHLLITIAKELRLNTSEQDFVARVNDNGGDEFAVLLPGLSKQQLPDVIARLQKIFSGGFDEHDHLIPTVSIGAVHTDDIGDADRSCLQDCADYAMYKAKEVAKSQPSITEHNVHSDMTYTLRKPTASYLYDPRTDGPVLTVKDALASFQAKPQARLK